MRGEQMGMRGPIRKPGAVRRQGKAEEGIEPAEIVMGAGAALPLPECPAVLRGEAAAEWERICGEMRAAGTLEGMDRAAIVEYCQAWATKVMADKSIAENGLTMETKEGMKARPEVGVAARQAGILNRYLDSFGLTPVGRARMNIKPARPEEKPKVQARKR